MKRDAFRRRLGRWLLEGGALFAVMAGAYKFYSDWREDRKSLSEEICRRADEAILDDDLNAALAEPQRQTYIARKLEISEECDRVRV